MEDGRSWCIRKKRPVAYSEVGKKGAYKQYLFAKRKLHVYLFALCTEKSGMVYSAFAMITSKESGVAESMNRNFLLLIFFFLKCLFFPIGIVLIL